MASLQHHIDDCIKFLGEPFDNVNRWIDELFRQYGPTHRRFRHHREGIEEARHLFGDRGALAAAVHVLRDCRHIPRQQDYELGYVDALGLKRHWSTSAYIKYSEGDFESLVQQLLTPSGLLLWAFTDANGIQFLLGSVTRLDQTHIKTLLSDWEKAVLKRNALPPFQPDSSAIVSGETATGSVAEYLQEIRSGPLFNTIASTQEASFAFVRLDQLITPLACLDYEYLDNLKPELASTEPLDVARFALPQTISMQVKAVADATQRNVTFVTNEKTLTVSPVQIKQTPDGTEVKFIVAANLSLILVANHLGRLIIRNGIHRAFLLAKMGVEIAPCIIIDDPGPFPSVHLSSYPAFLPPVLMQPRPPLLMDFFDSELGVQVPLQRTHKVIRISAEESVIPID